MSVQEPSSKPLLVVSVQQSLSQAECQQMRESFEPLAKEYGARAALVDRGTTIAMLQDLAPLVAVMTRVAENIEANTRAVRDLVEQITRGDDGGEVMGFDGSLGSESGYLNGR